MVYVDTNNPCPTVFIPTHGWHYAAVGLEMTLRNTTDGSEIAVPVTSSSAAGFLVGVTLQMPENFYGGEWQYRLTGTGGYVATGLLKAIDGNRTPAVQYNSEIITKQYGG